MSRHDDLWSFRQERWAGLAVVGFEVHAVNRHVGSVIDLCTEIGQARLVVDAVDWLGESLVLPAGAIHWIDVVGGRVLVHRSDREIEAAPRTLGADFTPEAQLALTAHYGPWGAGHRIHPAERRRVLLTHIMDRRAWEQALEVGEYVPDEVRELGFIPATSVYQTLMPANLLFSGRNDLVLLCIEQERLDVEVRWKEPQRTVERFPRICGPLNLDAVVAVVDFPQSADGSFALPAEILALG